MHRNAMMAIWYLLCLRNAEEKPNMLICQKNSKEMHRFWFVTCVNSIKFTTTFINASSPYEPSRIFRLSCVFGDCNPSPNPAGRLSQSVGFPIKDLRGRVSTKWWGSGNFASKPYDVWAMVMLKCCVLTGRNVNRDDQKVLIMFM